MQTNCRHKHVGCTVGKSEDMNATLQVTENYDLSCNTAIAEFMPLCKSVASSVVLKNTQAQFKSYTVQTIRPGLHSLVNGLRTAV